MSFVIPVAVNPIVIKNAITIVKKATIRPLFFMYMFLPLTALSLSCPLIHCHLPEQQLKPLDHLLDKRATLTHSYTYSGWGERCLEQHRCDVLLDCISKLFFPST